MSAVKISALPDATLPLDGTEFIPIVQGGTNKKITFADLIASIFQNCIAFGLVYFDGTFPASDSGLTSDGAGSLAASVSIVTTDAVFYNSLNVAGGQATINSGGNVQAASINAANVTADHFHFTSGTSGAVLYYDGVEISRDSGLTIPSTGTLLLQNLVAVATLSAGSSGFTVDASGNVYGNAIASGTGTSNSGLLTNFTIAAGIVTAAS